MDKIPERYVSLEEYFLLEETGEEKHEYYHGAIYDMTGASRWHNLIAINVGSILHTQLREKPCTVYPGELRLKVEAAGSYTYPDVQVVCGSFRYADGRTDTVTNPTLIIEVLSPSTEAYDRGKKFQQYRTIESLQAYLLIAQDSMHAELYLRQEEHRWQLVEYSQPEQQIVLAAIGCTLPLAAIYEKVEFDEG